MQHLVITVRFLDGRYHGLTDNGERTEWPPSPFRLFQALIAGNARGESVPQHVRPALRWLESLPAPEIVVPAHAPQLLPRLAYVPNNIAAPRPSRAPKVARPVLLDADRVIEFVWNFDDDAPDASIHAGAIAAATRHMRAFGRGIDLAVGDGAIRERPPATSESRVKFIPSRIEMTAGIDLRTPRVGSLDGLERAYQTGFRARYSGAGVVQLESAESSFAVVRYTDGAAERPFAAFDLLPPDPTTDPRPRKSFPQADAVRVAAMLRHTAWEAAKNDLGDWRDATWAEQFVAGHGPHAEPSSFARFSYLPLPNIPVPTVTHADGMIRRVLIAETPAPPACAAGDPNPRPGQSAAWAARRLAGLPLRAEGSDADVAILRTVPADSPDAVTRAYIRPSDRWQTVTPVVLPGFDGGSPAKRLKLLLRCFDQAGIPRELIADLDVQRSPWLRASATPLSYFRPDRLRALPACHVRVYFKRPVAGPLALGAGRHRGLGILMAMD